MSPNGCVPGNRGKMWTPNPPQPLTSKKTSKKPPPRSNLLPAGSMVRLVLGPTQLLTLASPPFPALWTPRKRRHRLHLPGPLGFPTQGSPFQLTRTALAGAAELPRRLENPALGCLCLKAPKASNFTKAESSTTHPLRYANLRSIELIDRKSRLFPQTQKIGCPILRALCEGWDKQTVRGKRLGGRAGG